MTPAGLCLLAYYFGVSVQAMTRRLEDLKLVATGSWDLLVEKGFKPEEAQRQLGLGPLPSRDSRTPLRYQYLAIVALHRGLITEGQFARFLRVDRIEARAILEAVTPAQAGGNSELNIESGSVQD